MVELRHEDTQAIMVIVSRDSQNGFFHLRDSGVKVSNFRSDLFFLFTPINLFSIPSIMNFSFYCILFFISSTRNFPSFSSYSLFQSQGKYPTFPSYPSQSQGNFSSFTSISIPITSKFTFFLIKFSITIIWNISFHSVFFSIPPVTFLSILLRFQLALILQAWLLLLEVEHFWVIRLIQVFYKCPLKN